MSRFAITIAYDGTDFIGWQRQAAGPSIQGLLEEALRALDGGAVAVTGAGRTDAGVHALGQVASFGLRREIEAAVLVRALNARLPATIRVLSAKPVAPAFNARFDARSKRYCYRICNAPVISPFERYYAWHIRDALDAQAMAAAAGYLAGRHDFASFQAAGSDVAGTERTITVSRVMAEATEDAEDYLRLSDERDRAPVSPPKPFDLCVPRVLRGTRFITYEIAGDGFLRHMVRTIVGTLVQVGSGRRRPDAMGEVLARRDRSAAGPTAPACGLFLVRVDYCTLAAEP